MARLTAAQRKALPDSAFAGPGRSFPVPDKAHAKAALMLEGNAPKSARAGITRKAEATLAKPKMTEAQDEKMDRKAGIRENSPADLRQDRKNGVMDTSAPRPTFKGKRK